MTVEIAATPVSAELKTAVVAAAKAHLASVTADVEKLTAALDADLSNVVTEVKSTVVSDFDRVEASFKAEIAKLKSDVSASKGEKIVGAVAALSIVAAAVSVVGHFAVHLL